MYITKGRYRGRKLLKRIFVFFVAFCSFALVAAANGIRLFNAYADNYEFTTIIETNNSNLGLISEGSDCSGTKTDKYTGTVVKDYKPGDVFGVLVLPSEGSLVVACPEDNARFVKWQVNSLDLNGVTGPKLYDYQIAQDSAASASVMERNTNTITAVFEADTPSDSYDVVIQANDSSRGAFLLSSGDGYTVTPNGTSSGQLSLKVQNDLGGVTTNELIIIPEPGYFFGSFTHTGSGASWQKAEAQNEYGYIFTLSGADVVTGNFVSYSDVIYDVSVNIPDAGSIDILDGSCSPETKTNQPFRKSLVYTGSNYISRLDTDNKDIVACVDNSSYRFKGWLVDGLRVSEDTVLDDEGYWPKSSQQHTLVAEFERAPYNVSVVTNNSEWGDIRLASGSNYIANPDNSDTDMIIITANPASGQITTSDFVITPAEGYRVAQGSPITVTGGNIDCQVQNNTCVLQFSDEASMTVNFEPIPSYTTNFTVNDSLKGKLAFGSDCNATKEESYSGTSENGQVLFPEGSNNSMTACPRDGFTFDHWEINGMTPSQGASNTTINEWTSWLQNVFSGDTTTVDITAVFAGDHHDYTVNFQTNETTAGDLEMANNSVDYSVNPDATPSDSIVVTTNSEKGLVQLNELLVTTEDGWEFVDFAISNAENVRIVNEDAENGRYVFEVYGPATVVANYRYMNSPRAIISVNDSSLGKVGYGGYKCNGGTYASSLTVDYKVFYNEVMYFDIPDNEISACPTGEAEFLYWEVNGVQQSTENQINKYSDAWAQIYTTDIVKVKYITAVFSGGGTPTNYTLPFTGSAMIWVLVGGGVGLVAIPSVILIISERKEQNKGGKK